MRILLSFLFVSFLTVSFGQTKAYKKMLAKYYNDFPTISIEDALKDNKSNKSVFLDVREEEEFNVSHIKYAIRMEPNGSGIHELKDIDKSTKIIVYCSVGARSQSFGEKLVKKGYTNVFNIYGGIFHWANSNYPLVNMYNQPVKNVHGYNADWGKWLNKNAVY